MNKIMVLLLFAFLYQVTLSNGLHLGKRQAQFDICNYVPYPEPAKTGINLFDQILPRANNVPAMNDQVWHDLGNAFPQMLLEMQSTFGPLTQMISRLTRQVGAADAQLGPTDATDSVMAEQFPTDRTPPFILNSDANVKREALPEPIPADHTSSAAEHSRQETTPVQIPTVARVKREVLPEQQSPLFSENSGAHSKREAMPEPTPMDRISLFDQSPLVKRQASSDICNYVPYPLTTKNEINLFDQVFASANAPAMSEVLQMISTLTDNLLPPKAIRTRQVDAADAQLEPIDATDSVMSEQIPRIKREAIPEQQSPLFSENFDQSPLLSEYSTGYSKREAMPEPEYMNLFDALANGLNLFGLHSADNTFTNAPAARSNFFDTSPNGFSLFGSQNNDGFAPFGGFPQLNANQGGMPQHKSAAISQPANQYKPANDPHARFNFGQPTPGMVPQQNFYHTQFNPSTPQLVPASAKQMITPRELLGSDPYLFEMMPSEGILPSSAFSGPNARLASNTKPQAPEKIQLATAPVARSETPTTAHQKPRSASEADPQSDARMEFAAHEAKVETPVEARSDLAAPSKSALARSAAVPEKVEARLDVPEVTARIDEDDTATPTARNDNPSVLPRSANTQSAIIAPKSAN